MRTADEWTGGAGGGATPASVAHLAQRPDPIPAGVPLREAVEAFSNNPDTRFLAVVDAAGRPVGAVSERTVRELLFSQFGHALLANPMCPWTLGQVTHRCGVAEQDAPIERLLTAFGDVPGAEGLILTRGGRYVGILPGNALLRLAAERERAEQTRIRAAAAAASARAEKLEQAFAAFRTDAATFGADLARAASAIRVDAVAMADRSVRNGSEALAVAAAATQSSDSIAEIAVSGSELADQGRRIERRVVEAMDGFEAAGAHVDRGTERATALGEAANSIGGIVNLISDVAAKVNLLAVNATIEAARAGPAGRTFAVVAGEVKSLADQVSEAARRIDGEIGAVRRAVADNGAAIRSVDHIVHELAAVCRDITLSVQEQGRATRLIAENVDQAAQGSARVSHHIGMISDRAGAAGELAMRLGEVADALVCRAEEHGARVDSFLAEMRAA